MPAELLTRGQLDAAFEMLSDRLVDRATDASVVLFGDAAMMFAHDARTAIHHVDAAPTPRGIVLGAARDTGQQLDLPAYWFNDQASSSLPKYLADDFVELWERPNLHVRTLNPELLLAMTALTPNRPEDIDDIRRLANQLGMASSIDIEVLVAEIFPGRSLTGKARSTLDEMF